MVSCLFLYAVITDTVNFVYARNGRFVLLTFNLPVLIKILMRSPWGWTEEFQTIPGPV